LIKAVEAALAKHIDDASGNRFQESRNVPGADAFRALFSDAGFERVKLTATIKTEVGEIRR